MSKTDVLLKIKTKTNTKFGHVLVVKFYETCQA